MKGNLQFFFVYYHFRTYEQQLSKKAKRLITDISFSLRPVCFDEDDLESDGEERHVTLGTKLFELYLALQQFYRMSGGVKIEVVPCQRSDGSGSDSGNESNGSSSSSVSFQLEHFHRWFLGAVDRWLDIALLKAMRRISRAVQMDRMEAVDDLVRYTNSAVDLR